MRIPKYEIILIPKEGTAISKVHKMDLKWFILSLVVAGIISHIVFILLLIYTPIRHFLPAFDIVTQQESQELTVLKNRLEILTTEFEKVRERNIRLSYILDGKPIPIDKRLLDSNYMKERYIKDSTNLFSKTPFSNNILFVWKLFLSDFLLLQKDSSDNEKTQSKRNIFFYFPTTGVMTQDFNTKSGHLGIDIGVKRGTVIRAAASGIVIFADFTINDGNKIIISHSDGYMTIYKHLAVLLRKEKELVNQSDVIALSGNSGTLTTSPHLHFEIWKDNTPVDPKKILINYDEN